MKNGYFYSWGLYRCVTLVCMIFAGFTAGAQFNKQGLAPVQIPAGGFSIDGNAYSNSPSGTGDWFQAPGAGGYVLNSDGTLAPGVMPDMTRHYTDPYRGDAFADNIFTSSNKINDNPATYTFGPGNVPPKDEMQQATVHFSYGDPLLGGSAEDLWCVFAADRWKTNGASYIDFEFMQSRFDMNGDGTFTSNAPATDVDGVPTGGRTPGDILVTVVFSGGGSKAYLYIDVWTKVGTSYQYVRNSLAERPDWENYIYCTENTVVTPVGWPIYDQTSPYEYAVNQYAEGAINLTQIMGSGECGHLSSVWVRTKTSGETANAELKDFPGVFNVDLGTDPPVVSCPADVNLPACTSAAAIASAFQTWKSGFSVSGGVNATDNLASFPALPDLTCGGSVSFEYVATDDCHEPQRCSSTFTVTAAPAVSLTAPQNETLEACQTQAEVTAAYNAWLAEAVYSGGCGLQVTHDGTGKAPAFCGGSVTVKWSATSNCAETVEKSATFTVTAAPAVSLTAPQNETLEACHTQAEVTAAYNAWLAEAVYSGGCGLQVTHDGTGKAPAFCGGSVTVKWSATSSCAETVEKSATFTVTAAPAVSLTAPQNETLEACQTQAEVTAAYNAWLAEAVYSGGCGLQVTHDGTGKAPAFCGGSVTVKWSATSSCAETVEKSATFTVTAAPAVSLTAPQNETLEACQTQAEVTAAYNAWLAEAVYSGGCGLQVTHDGTGKAPAFCGGSVTVKWSATSSCAETVEKSATFTVTAAPAVSLTAPQNETLEACQTQAEVTAAYNAWLAEAVYSGGCGLQVTHDGTGKAPAFCGGSVTVKWSATSNCAETVEKSATFTVTSPDQLVVSCPANKVIPACTPQDQILEAYQAWKAGFTATGDCNLADNMASFPDLGTLAELGGTLNFTFQVTGSCDEDQCSSSFTVEPCLKDEFCTYTQGFYGSQKGTACTLEGSLRGDVFTAGLLSQGDLIIGSLVKGNYVNFSAGANAAGLAKVIQSILPGGQSSASLSGACTVTASSSGCLSGYLSKQGKINNQLFSQTLVLGLNLRINEGLGDVQLVAGKKFLVTQEKASCEEGSGGVAMVCTPQYDEFGAIIGYVRSYDPYDYYQLPQHVIGYLATNGYPVTISGLYRLANDALGKNVVLPMMSGGMEVKLSDIASAVDMINNAFDECRILVGFMDEKFSCEGEITIKSAVKELSAAMEIKAYPNPFSDRVTFEFVPGSDGHARLEIFNMLGQKISTLLDRPVEKGNLQRIGYEPTTTPGILFYKLSLGTETYNGKLLYKK